jgi:hypothetical protein
MTIRGRYTVVRLAMVASLLAACGDSSAITSCSLMSCATASAPVSFALSPDSAHILLGDTTHFYTWSCARGPCVDLDESGNLYSNWTISGGSVMAVAGGGITSEVLFARRIVVRGESIGSATIRAIAAGDSSKTRAVSIFVADSSVIDAVQMTATATTFKVGELVTVDARVLGGGTQYIARPTSWAASDTSVVELLSTQFERGVERRTVRAKKVGTADLLTGFRNAQGVLRVTVAP